MSQMTWAEYDKMIADDNRAIAEAAERGAVMTICERPGPPSVSREAEHDRLVEREAGS